MGNNLPSRYDRVYWRKRRLQAGARKVVFSMLDRAIGLIRDGSCTAAVVTVSGKVFAESGQTVRPLLRIHDAHLAEMEGGAAADRIIGRAAACLLCHAKVSAAFAFLMSESAMALFDEYGIAHSCDSSVPFIANMRGDGLCPMEQAVEGVDDLEEAAGRLREFVRTVPEPDFGDE